MASLLLIGDTYHLCFRFGGRNGRQFRRSLETADEGEANARRKRAEALLHDLKTGRVRLPEGADIGTFILSDGQAAAKPSVPKLPTLGEVFDQYLESTAFHKKADTTQITERTHINNLSRLLKRSTVFVSVTAKDFQRYIDLRRKDPGIRGGRVKADTIRKELATLSVIWNDWAKPQGVVKVRFDVQFDDKLSFVKEGEKPPFDTFDHIEKKVARGGLSSSQVLDLWDCLYLDEVQVKEVLERIERASDKPPWLYPAAVLVAHTGCRRSEMRRSQVGDFDLDTGQVRLREKKRSRSKEFTFRHVRMSSLVRQVLGEYLDNHPGGQLTFCDKPGNLVPPKAVHDALKDAVRGSRWEVIRGWHIFRHSYASIMASRGVDQRLIDADLGHQTEAMRRRYQHLFPKQRELAHHGVFG